MNRALERGRFGEDHLNEIVLKPDAARVETARSSSAAHCAGRGEVGKNAWPIGAGQALHP